MRTLVALAVALLLFLTGCQSDDAPGTASPDPVTTATATDTTASAPPNASTPSSAPDPGSGSVSTDPCDLLTSGMAEGALGLPVGSPTTTPQAGSLTCMYTPADGRPNVFVLLTTYEASGEAALTTATKEFPDAEPVPDLGDAAYISPRGHAIGVLDGDLLFAMSLLRPDGLEVPLATSAAQLVTLARTVLESR